MQYRQLPSAKLVGANLSDAIVVGANLTYAYVYGARSLDASHPALDRHDTVEVWDLDTPDRGCREECASEDWRDRTK